MISAKILDCTECATHNTILYLQVERLGMLLSDGKIWRPRRSSTDCEAQNVRSCLQEGEAPRWVTDGENNRVVVVLSSLLVAM